MMEAYKSWVRRNQQWISSFDSVANTMTWLLPERLANSELTPETVSTLLGLLRVMNEHIIQTAPGPMGQGSVPHQLSLPDSDEDRSISWSLCISVVKEVEVLTEMAAEHYLGKSKKWGPVASLEAIKVLLRLIILQKSGYKMLLDGGQTKNIAGLAGFREANVPEDLTTNVSLREDTLGRPVLKRPALSSEASREVITPPFYSRDLEGRAMHAMQRFGENRAGPNRPSWLRQLQSPQGDTSPQVQLAYNPRPVSLEPKKSGYRSRAFICGEVLLISRPLLYILLVWRYGLKSWRPWVAALSVDLTGMYLVLSSTSLRSMRSTGLGNLQEGASNLLSTPEVQELRRRQLHWALYIMRSPFFDQYTRRRVEAVENILSPIPLVGMLAGKAVELVLQVQELYSYTSAS